MYPKVATKGDSKQELPCSVRVPSTLEEDNESHVALTSFLLHRILF